MKRVYVRSHAMCVFCNDLCCGASRRLYEKRSGTIAHSNFCKIYMKVDYSDISDDRMVVKFQILVLIALQMHINGACVHAAK